jgi:hypothetical protein
MKIDYKTWQINFVAKYRTIPGEIVLDSSNYRNFIIHSFSYYITGSLTGNRIIFGSQKEVPFLNYLKLIGNRLFGFRRTNRQNDAGIPLWQYCEVNLTTLTEKKVDVPMILADKRIDLSYIVSF